MSGNLAAKALSEAETQALKREIARYLEMLRSERRLLETSLNVYEIELSLMLSLMKKGGLSELKKHLSRCQPSTHLRKLGIWRAFFNFCGDPWSELLQNEQRPKLRQKQIDFIDDETAFRLESACYRMKQPSRSRLFLALGMELGLRIGEISRLRFSNFQNEWLRLVRKGGKEQRLPLNKNIQAQVNFWKQESVAQDTDYLFEGRDGGPMSVRNLQKLLDKIAKEAGLSEKIHPHQLRHRFASVMASNGASLASLKEFLGHERITTTERYLHVTPSHLRDSLQFLKPTKPS